MGSTLPIRDDARIEDIALFRGLYGEDIERIAKIGRFKRLEAGNILFFEGDAPKTLHLLIEGVVKIYKVDEKGTEVVLHYIRGENLIAEIATFEDIPYPATAVCESDVLLFMMDGAAFMQMFADAPVIAKKIIQSLCMKIRFLEGAITHNLTMSAEAKLAKFLHENERSLPSLSQRKIATMLNITPETCSRIIAGWKQRGIVKVERRVIVILDRGELLKIF